MTQAELLRYVVEVFERLGIAYMIGGSQASIYFGEPRFTQDIDIVVEATVADLAGLLQHFPPSDFYLSQEAAREAIQERGQFNIIHPASGLKIDLILKKDGPYDRVEFERRIRLPLIPGMEAYFARPEDVILYKLIYFKAGESERHLRDIAGILRVSRTEIDVRYVTDWAQRLGLSDLWGPLRDADR